MARLFSAVLALCIVGGIGCALVSGTNAGIGSAAPAATDTAATDTAASPATTQ
jgi:hypothetical protein